MGTGIGKDCEICCQQLNYNTGFNFEETLCKDCEELIPKLDMLLKTIEELNYKPIEPPKSEPPKDYFFTYCIGWTIYILIVVLLFIF